MDVSNVPCPMCGSETREYVKSAIDPDTFFREESEYAIAAGGRAVLPVLQCEVCGHGFTPVSISSAELAAWYARAQLDETFVHQQAARRKTAQVTLARLGQIYPAKGRLLDIGCGPGLFLDEAKRRGWQVQGVEPASWAIAWSRHHLGDLSIMPGDYEELKSLPAESLDVVTAFDVIEHVVDPINLLQAIARVLKPGGVVILTTPKFDSLMARLMGRKWYCIFPAHIHYFSDSSLRLILNQAVFHIVKRCGHTRYLGVGYLMERLLAFLGKRDGTRMSKRFLTPIPVYLGDEFEVYAKK